MRIAFVLASLAPSGGRRAVFRLADELINRGHEAILFLCRGEQIAQTYETEARIMFAKSNGRLVRGSMGSLFNSVTQLGNLQCDVLIATYYPTAYLVYLARLLGNHTGQIAYFVQGRESLFCQGRLSPLKRAFANSSYRLPLKMLTNSRWTSDEILRIGKKKATVIGLGIDQQVFHPPVDARRNPTERGLIMTIGRHQEIKGYPDFLEAMRLAQSKLSSLRLLVVSQEDLEIPPDLEGEVVRPQSDRELVTCFHRAQVYVSSSWYEGFGLPGLEAMACGTPLVTTDSGGVIEYAEHGRNCLVCPARQPAELARAVLTLLQDDTLQERFASQGIHTAARFSWQEAALKLEAALLGGET